MALHVQRVLGGDFGECAHGLDQSYWDLHVDGGVLTIHREHYLGVSVFCKDEQSSVRQLRRFAELQGSSLL